MYPPPDVEVPVVWQCYQKTRCRYVQADQRVLSRLVFQSDSLYSACHLCGCRNTAGQTMWAGGLNRLGVLACELAWRARRDSNPQPSDP